MNPVPAIGSAVKAVVFDVDGVLLDSKAANIAWYRAFLAQHGYYNLADAELERGHYSTLREAIALMTKAPEARVQAIWEAASELKDYPNELLSLPDGCVETLEALSRSYPLAIVTSRIREGVAQFFAFSGLRAFFSVVVSFEDYARPKPDPEPLLTACERLGVAATEVVYIGDAPTDLECARAAGARFIAYGDAIGDAEHALTSFGALPSLLRDLARS